MNHYNIHFHNDECIVATADKPLRWAKGKTFQEALKKLQEEQEQK